MCKLYPFTLFTRLPVTEGATGGVLQEKLFLEISQNSQEETCARVSLLIKLQVSAWLSFNKT